MIATRPGPFDRGHHAPAPPAGTRLSAETPHEQAERLFLRGMAEADTGRIRPAIAAVQAAVAIAPRSTYLAQLARLFTLVRQDADAAATVRLAEAGAPGTALDRDTIGCVHARLGNHAAALGHFAEAVRLQPDNSEFRYNLAATLNFLGKTDEAETALETLIAQAPGHARAHHLLAALRRQTASHNHIERLGHVRANATEGRDRLLLGYALAKEMEDVGEPEQALDMLCEANREHRATLPYDFARDAAIFDAVKAIWPQLSAASVDDASSEDPIFVIGMPRTGTTLVDRILSSHPQVESAGELQAMPLAVKKAAGTRTATVLDTDTLAAAASGDMAAIGRDYLVRARSHRRDPGLRFTDKFPGNFHYAGVIAQALPNARIVCLRRDPMDTVLANFRNLFAVGSRYYDYSYDLAEIAQYYLRFDRLMAFWREALPGRVLEVRYEDMVADQEGQTRRLLDHCGLSWSDDCLDFHTNKAPVSTPSAAQVRRPIYSESVGRWRRHADVLAPARQMFEQAGLSIS